MCRILERNGWERVRVKGSHYAYEKPGDPNTVIVPVHGNKDLKNGHAARHHERRGSDG